MGENSHIEWTHHTFNPWVGCTKVSPGCAHCYAEKATFVNAQRKRGRELWGAGRERWRTSEETWHKPRVWNARAMALGVRERVFCASLADWLDDEVPLEWLADLLALIEATPHLDWLLLTKRPELFPHRLHKISRESPLAAHWHMLQRPPSNVWVGTTVEDQVRAEERIPALLKIPARVRFLSCEPLLELVDITHWLEVWGVGDPVRTTGIDWVICGGESGHDARPMHPDWAIHLGDQCHAAGVAFHFKQWGEWLPVCADSAKVIERRCYVSNRKAKAHEDQGAIDESYGRRCTVDHHVLHLDGAQHRVTDDGAFLAGKVAMTMFRVGKRAAGRQLDGREWNELPKIAGGGNS